MALKWVKLLVPIRVPWRLNYKSFWAKNKGVTSLYLIGCKKENYLFVKAKYHAFEKKKKKKKKHDINSFKKVKPKK
jgi:hypothetical protein